MKNINFIEIDKYKTNASVIAFLSQHEYKFEPINFYDRNRFYCVVKKNEETYFGQKIKKIMKKMGVTVKDSFNFYPLTILCPCFKMEDDTPMVFSRKEVMNILSDIPENYIGEKNI